MGNSLATLSLAAALSVGNVQATWDKTPDFSALMESGNPRVGQVIHDTQARITPLAQETGVLVAQANIEDGRTWPYYTMVPQKNGWVKKIEYYKNKRGLIIPPPVENGKLVDGSDAPVDPIGAKAEQRTILSQYDSIILAKTERRDILLNAGKKLEHYYSLAEQWRLTKDQLFDAFYETYLLTIWDDNPSEKGIEWSRKIISGIETYGKIKLKMQVSEISSIKQNAEIKTKELLRKLPSSAA